MAMTWILWCLAAPVVTGTLPDDQPTDGTTDTAVRVKFNNPFSSRNGEIEAFSVIVSKRERLPPNMPEVTWEQAQADGGIYAYVAIYRCANFFQQGENCAFGATLSRRRRKRQTSPDVAEVMIGKYWTMQCSSGVDGRKWGVLGIGLRISIFSSLTCRCFKCKTDF